MTYEYHVLHVNDDWLTSNKTGNALEFLDDIGKGGWDLASTITLADQTHILIFRKVNSN